jgi:hypothetical protein
MDISAWLRGLGLERYEQAFRENAIDEASLPKLTAEDLTDLGVTAVGHRRILLDAIAASRTERNCKATEHSGEPDRSGANALRACINTVHAIRANLLARAVASTL